MMFSVCFAGGSQGALGGEVAAAELALRRPQRRPRPLLPQLVPLRLR